MGARYRLGIPFLIGLCLFLFLAELASPFSLSPAAAASLESTDDYWGDDEEIDEFPTLDETELYYEEFPPEEDLPTEEYFDEEGTLPSDEYLEGTLPVDEETAPPAIEILSPTPGVDLFRAEDNEMSQALDPRLLEATLPLALPPTATTTPAPSPTQAPARLSDLPIHWPFFAVGLLGALLLGVLGWIIIKPSH